MEFVNSMRKKGQLIMGIGHRVKSVGINGLYFEKKRSRQVEVSKLRFCVVAD